MEKSIFQSANFIDLMKNKEFIEEISNKKTREEIKDTFSKKGVKMEDADLDQFAKDLETVYINNVSGGKSFGEAAGNYIEKHPWLTFFMAVSVVHAPAAIIKACNPPTINIHQDPLIP